MIRLHLLNLEAKADNLTLELGFSTHLATLDVIWEQVLAVRPAVDRDELLENLGLLEC